MCIRDSAKTARLAFDGAQGAHLAAERGAHCLLKLGASWPGFLQGGNDFEHALLQLVSIDGIAFGLDIEERCV